MKNNSQLLTTKTLYMKTIYWTTLFCLFFAVAGYSQEENPMTKEKGKRTGKTIDSKELNPIVIDGRKNTKLQDTTLRMLPNVAIQQKFPNLKISYDNKNGMPIMIKGNIGNKVVVATQQGSAEDAAYEYLEQVEEALQIEDASLEFFPYKTETDELGMTHIRMKQYFQGVEVYVGEVLLHTDKIGKINMLNGRFFPTPNLDNVVPVITMQAGIDFAVAAVKKETVYKELSDKEKALLESEQAEAKLVVFHKDNDINKEVLTWHITVRPNFIERWEYFVDARTGEIHFRLNHTCSLDGPATATAIDLQGITRTINVYEVSGTYYTIDASQSMFNAGLSSLPDDPRGAIWTIDANNTSPQGNLNVSHVSSSNNTWNNPTAVSAHYNGEQSYLYFKNTHNRNSINGTGGRVVSIINVSDAQNNSMDNAFWNGAAIFYGNGGNAFQPLAKSLDVAGHEMSHGVVSNSANLVYQGESGALNESFADIFGVMIDRDDWLLGDDIVNTNVFTSGALRSMSDPHNGGSSLNHAGYQPRHMNEKYTGSNDNGGVHINSGIVNWAFYKYATAVGKDKAEDTYYRALTVYLTANSQFVDARVGIVQAAEDLYGAGSAEATAVGTAFDQVGIMSPGGGNPGNGGNTGVGVVQPGNLPPVTGSEFILSVDVNSADPNTLYISSTTASNFNGISQTSILRPPSITDDGSFAVYVGSDNIMYGINLDGTSTEFVIHGSAIWSNAAISKDGSRIAAITTSQDTSIWIFDFGLGSWGQFILSNPSFTQGVSSGDVLYADAIEFDYSGNYVIYDALNQINGFSGNNIQYWDVGVLEVWDSTTNDFGSGTISKLFSNLPEDVSIGNPSISKNSPSIIAFDYIDASQSPTEYYLVGVDLVTGTVGTIYQNDRLNYPNYSRLDDKMIFNGSDNFGNAVIGIVGLGTDKITATTQPTLLISNAKWGKWYTQGSRLTSIENTVSPLEGVSIFPNPVSDELTVSIENIEDKGNISVFNITGQLIESVMLSANTSNFRETIDFSNLPSGVYTVKVQIGNQVATEKVVKMD